MSINSFDNKSYGLAIFAHGTPRSEDEFEEFLLSIRRNRPVPTELLNELKRRYSVIGGLSPLLKITESFFRKLVDEAGKLVVEESAGFKIFASLGYKHVKPNIFDAVKELVESDVSTIFGLIATPYFSPANIADYYSSAEESLRKLKKTEITFKRMPPLSEIEGYDKLIVKRLQSLLTKIPHLNLDRTLVIFTAHSLPIIAVQNDNTYQSQHTNLALSIAQECNLKNFRVAYQSGTLGKGDWLAPDINEIVISTDPTLVDAVIAVPIGFVSEHAEILYDLDIEVKNNCLLRRINYFRVKMFNDDEDFINLISEFIIDFIITNG